MCAERRSIIPSFSPPLSFSTQLLGPSQGALQDGAASGFRILQLSTSSFSQLHFCCAPAQKRLCSHVRYVKPTSPLNQVLMPMARSRRVLSCAPRVLALFGELWHTFPGLLQLEKYFCTRVLESSGRSFPGLLQSFSAHVRYVESRSTLDQFTNILARSLHVLSVRHKYSLPSSSESSGGRFPGTFQAALPSLHQFFKQLWHTFPGLLQLEKYFCTSSSDSSGRPLPGTFQWLSMLLPRLSSSCYSCGPASLHALTTPSIQSSSR
jgi:hypothetical protein